MIGTFSSHPFVSFDGPDEKGVRAEVKVILGFGYVEKAVADSEKALKVFFKVDKQKYSIYARLAIRTETEDAVALVKQAAEEQFPIHFRIEIVRKNDKDRTIPISELTSKEVASDSVYRQLTGVAKSEDDWKWGVRYTNPKEDVYYKPSGNGMFSAANMTDEELAKYHAQSKSNIQTSAVSTSYSGDIDPPPYVVRRKDGTVNLSGYGVNIPFNVLSFVLQHIRENKLAIDKEWAKHIAKRLFNMSNTIQMKVYEGELLEPAPSMASHTKIRSIVFEVVRSLHPVTDAVKDNKEEENKWLASVYKESLSMWNWSMETAGFIEGTEEDDNNE